MVILLLVYHLLLEREKMHRFNRFFLLFSLVFGLTIPLLTFQIGTPTVSDFQLSSYLQEIQQRTTSFDSPAVSATKNTTSSSGNHYWLLLSGYLVVTLAFAARFLRNLYSLYSTIRQNDQREWEGANLVLVENCSIPHSFFSYIFVDKQEFKSGNIDSRILSHELAHVRQKHSLDILFIELLKIVLWFNPAIYFYKKAIQLNHEFLADNAVTAQSQDIASYQQLLLRMKSQPMNLSLASSIQYSITKKRIVMITKQSTRLRTVCKQFTLIPLLAGLVFMFSTANAQAQKVDDLSITELMDAIHAKMETTKSLSGDEKQKLQHLIEQMQQKLMQVDKPKNPPPPPPVPKNDPKAALEAVLQSYQDHIRTYNNISAIPENKQRLNTLYERAMSLHNEIDKLQKEIHTQDPPPPPPIPLSPKERIEK